ncbi:hypothetical protein GCM10023341_04990 [Ornithinimicrobium tianjinense]
MRPSRVTAVASVMTNGAPPTAKETRCARCQSVTNPGSLGRQEYWHIGETQTRPGTVSDLNVRGENSMAGMLASLGAGMPKAPNQITLVGGLRNSGPAVSYSPTPSPVQYHRRCQA